MRTCSFFPVKLGYIPVQYQPRAMIKPTQYSTRANNSTNKNSKHTPMKIQTTTILGKFYRLSKFQRFLVQYCSLRGKTNFKYLISLFSVEFSSYLSRLRKSQQFLTSMSFLHRPIYFACFRKSVKCVNFLPLNIFTK